MKGVGALYKKLFKNRNFILLTAGGFISSIGDYLYNIGITVYLYDLTKSVGAVAIMWLARAVLRIPMLYISGIVADSCNKKKTIMVTNLISVILAFLFIFVNSERIWLVYILAFLLQSLNDIDMNSETAILPQLVSKEELSYSNSIFSFLESTTVFLSPAIGGMLYKFYGSNVLFIINASSFLAAGILFAFIKYSFSKPQVVVKESGIIRSGIEGYKILTKYPNIRTVFIVSSIFAIIGRFYETYKVAVSDVLLNMKPEGIVYFDYALAIGGLAVPLIVKILSKRNNVSIFIVSTIAVGIGYIIFGYSHRIIISFAALIMLGFTQNIQGIYSRTLIQNNVPKEYVGRIYSFYKILLTSFAIIGLLIAAPLYNFIGIGHSFLIFSVILVFLSISRLRSYSNSAIENTQ